MDVFIFNFFFIIFPIKLSKIQNINKEPQKKDTCPPPSHTHSLFSSPFFFFFFFFFITFHIQFSLFSFFSLFRLIVTLTLYVIILATKKKTLIY
jgi:hypothetical protein